MNTRTSSPNDTIAAGDHWLTELCRQADSGLAVASHTDTELHLSWQAHERLVRLSAEELAAIRHDPNAFKQRIRDLGRALRTEGLTEVIDEAGQLSDEDVLERVADLARSIVGSLLPEASVRCEQFVWHGDRTLDIRVSFRGATRNTEVSASRARDILPDYVWKSSNGDLEDELLYHDLEELLNDLRSAASKHKEHAKGNAIPAP